MCGVCDAMVFCARVMVKLLRYPCGISKNFASFRYWFSVSFQKHEISPE